MRRNNASISDDFPLPVRPTTPQLVPPCSRDPKLSPLHMFHVCDVLAITAWVIVSCCP